MDWVQNGDSWESGPYVIELWQPGHWVLNISSNSEESLVRSQENWTARSLSQLKRTAETLEARKRQTRSTQIRLLLLAASLFVFAGAATGSGRISALVAIASAGLILFSIAGVIDGMRFRPWDSVRDRSQ